MAFTNGSPPPETFYTDPVEELGWSLSDRVGYPEKGGFTASVPATEDVLPSFLCEGKEIFRVFFATSYVRRYCPVYHYQNTLADMEITPGSVAPVPERRMVVTGWTQMSHINALRSSLFRTSALSYFPESVDLIIGLTAPIQDFHRDVAADLRSVDAIYSPVTIETSEDHLQADSTLTPMCIWNSVTPDHPEQGLLLGLLSRDLMAEVHDKMDSDEEVPWKGVTYADSVALQ